MFTPRRFLNGSVTLGYHDRRVSCVGGQGPAQRLHVDRSAAVALHAIEADTPLGLVLADAIRSWRTASSLNFSAKPAGNDPDAESQYLPAR